MLTKIKILGSYIGKDKRGIIVGGKPFAPNYLEIAQVDEDTFNHLRAGVKAGWFDIKDSNYVEFLRSRQRFEEMAFEMSNKYTLSTEQKDSIAQALTNDEKDHIEVVQKVDSEIEQMKEKIKEEARKEEEKETKEKTATETKKKEAEDTTVTQEQAAKKKTAKKKEVSEEQHDDENKETVKEKNTKEEK